MRKGADEAGGIDFAGATQAVRALGQAAAFCVGLAAMVALVVVMAAPVAVMVVSAIVPALIASAAHGPKKRISGTHRSLRAARSQLASIYPHTDGSGRG